MASNKLSKRQSALLSARIAGYHGDSSTFTRLRLTSGVVSFGALSEAWRQGQAAKSSGVPCGCRDCGKVAA